MNTVQFECGHCGKLMAVSTEHLGSQVHCPHCQGIVEAPRPEAPQRDTKAAETMPPALPSEPSEMQFQVSTAERDSIFAGSGDLPSEDVFGTPAAPKVELPVPAGLPVPAEQIPDQTLPSLTASRPEMPASLPEDATESYLPPPGANPPHFAGLHLGQTEHAFTTQPMAPIADHVEAHLGPAVPRVPKRSHVASWLLIFLIPYSITATVFAVSMYLQARNAPDHLERMLDPNPADGGPRRIQHDIKLPKKLRTSLRRSLRIGDLEVAPLKVVLVPEGDLVLHLKMRNLSSDTAFNPMPNTFLHYQPHQKGNKPYTYLETGSERLYGGEAKWREIPQDFPAFDVMLQPGQEAFATVTTYEFCRREVKALTQTRDDLLWRLHVRRGLVTVRGQSVSTTAVIGVEFSASAIEKQL